jgi:hypothetical protein
LEGVSYKIINLWKLEVKEIVPSPWIESNKILGKKGGGP